MSAILEGKPAEALLCVVTMHSNTGFAWNYIEGLYAGVANALAAEGVITYVSYPKIYDPPKSLEGSAARAILLDARLDSWKSVRQTISAIRRLNIRTIYFTDRCWWHWAHPLLRAAGVRRIVAHDHTSGERAVPRGLRRAFGWLKARIPLMSADVVVTVSEYVARRQLHVWMARPSRVVPLWNGIELPSPEAAALPPPIPEMAAGRPSVLCVCRAAREKGVDHLLRAFDGVIAQWPANEPRPILVYVGDGPTLEELQALRASLSSRDDIILTGYRDDVPRFIAHATLAAVPSVWQDACPLGVLEPMAHGKPVVASAVGGVPEQIPGSDVGQLVPAGDPDALASAITSLLRDAPRRAAVGRAAKERIIVHFNRGRQMARLVGLVRGGEAARAAMHP